MKHNSIIVIQVSSVAGEQSRFYFDRQGIKRNEDYMLFRVLEGALDRIEPGAPQLVFTSHDNATIKAWDVARTVKEKNPKAIVIAFSSNEIEPSDYGDLDGSVYKFGDHPMQQIKAVCQAFLSGANRKSVLEALNYASPAR